MRAAAFLAILLAACASCITGFVHPCRDVFRYVYAVHYRTARDACDGEIGTRHTECMLTVERRWAPLVCMATVEEQDRHGR